MRALFLALEAAEIDRDSMRAAVVCKMKAFTFRGLLLTGFATHPHMWIHSDLSVFLNVLELKELLRKVAFKNFELRAWMDSFFKVEEMWFLNFCHNLFLRYS